jgi:hypothetical protein
MKLMAVLTVSFAFVVCGAFSRLKAQDASVAPASDVDQCVKWMKATVTTRALGPTEFCFRYLGRAPWRLGRNLQMRTADTRAHRQGTQVLRVIGSN